MGRKDAAKIAQQLIAQGKNYTEDTPVQILEAVSTSKERQWENNLGALAQGKADNWFDRNSPALIMVGEALRSKQSTTTESQSSSTEIDNGLQDSQILPNGRRSA